MKTMYSKYNAADRTIQRDINAAVASVFHKYPDYNPRELAHEIAKSATLQECNLVLLKAMDIRKKEAEKAGVNPRRIDTIKRLREAGCMCQQPLLGYRDGVGPRCRLCNTETKDKMDTIEKGARIGPPSNGGNRI